MILTQFFPKIINKIMNDFDVVNNQKMKFHLIQKDRIDCIGDS